MLEYRIRIITLAIAAALTASSTLSADTWRLGQDPNFKPVSAQDKFLLAVAETKKLVSTGQAKAAEEAFDKLKKDFPEITGPDLDDFIKAEIFLCQAKFTKAYHSYERLLTNHPQSKLRQAVLDRQFAIATAYLGGQKKQLFKFIKLKGDSEGVRIMEKITERAGIDSLIGLKAALAAAKNYEKRKLFNDAYKKWRQISLEWYTTQTGKEALLSMAQCKHAEYNKHPEYKRPFYDASNLSIAKTHYRQFNSKYPEDARKIGVDEIVKQIDEQLAQKQLSIGSYYRKTGNIQSANLYFDMVVKDWPGTKAAESAKQARAKNPDTKEKNK